MKTSPTRFENALAQLTAVLARLSRQVSPSPDGKIHLLVAFSGGTDSSLLLRLCHEAAPALGLFVGAAHVNHGIRGEESLRDRDFCQSTAQALNVPFYSVDLDIPALAAQNGEGCEITARRARYDWMADIMQREGYTVLATAHNADDVLETMLFRLARGTAGTGLCGIPESRPLDREKGLVVWRPLLDFSKQDVLAVCRDAGIAFVTDSTNNDTDYARNRIRHNVVPELEALFERPQAAARRLSLALAADEEYIREGVETLWQACHDNPAAGARVLLAAPLTQAPAALRRRVLARWLSQNGLDPEGKHLLAAEALLCRTPGPLSLSCPGGMTLCMRNHRKWLCLVPTHPEKEEK